MCDCVARVNEKLAERNTRLVQAMVFDAIPDHPNLMIETYQIETGRGTKKKVGMFASYCPFCGEKYPVREEGAAS